MHTAVVKQILLMASFATMIPLEIHSAPAKRCHLSHYRHLQNKEKAPTDLRDKYEELRYHWVQPWQNCSGEHLKPQWKLDGLTKWEKLEAVEMEVDLAIHVLQNQSEPAVAKDASSRVLQILTQLKDDLGLCMRLKPASHKASGHFLAFQEHFQKFNSSNAAQSSQCLEAAVGLNIVGLLQEVNRVSREHHHHHHPRSN